MRILVFFWGLYWGPLILGNYHVDRICGIWGAYYDIGSIPCSIYLKGTIDPEGLRGLGVCNSGFRVWGWGLLAVKGFGGSGFKGWFEVLGIQGLGFGVWV